MGRLSNKNIYYIITGAPKAKYAPDIINEMIAEGANVFTVPTKTGENFIDLSELRKIKGNTVKNDWDEKIKLPREDAVLIAPCTFHTFNSIASGKADTYALNLIASSIGQKKPVFIAPAMNKSLWDHPIIQKNIGKLEKWGCRVIWPEITPEKVTMIDIGKILDTLYFNFKRVRYTDKKIDQKDLLEILHSYRKKYFEEFAQIGDFLKKNSLNLYSAGCMSIKVDEGFLITSSGSDMSELKEQNISFIKRWDEKNNTVEWCGDLIPSSETPLHCVIHEQKKYSLVLHIHCPKITYSNNLKKHNSAHYIRYGTFEIGHKAINELAENNFFIMKYHGEVISGKNTEELKKTILTYFKKS